MDEQLLRRRHSAAHIMAAAVQNLFDDVKFDIGPATEEGFYYDFDMEHRLIPDDLPKIEEEMRKLAEKKDPFICTELSRDEATESLNIRHQNYKIERLQEIPEGDKITFSQCGEFIDLCRGPHVEHTGDIGAFKLLSIAGSYYRGNENNPMLQRVYGTSFHNEKGLRVYLKNLEEAKKRDHRKINTELELYSVSEDIGPGLILWHPNGARIRNAIENFWRDTHYKNGYEMLYTPHLGFGELWQTSGHLDFYKEAMYSPLQIDDRDYYVKPMNCPFHIKIYQSRNRSYKELPARWAEFGTVYRYEKSGVMHGLFRVRGFTQDDAHIFCTPKQVDTEISEVLKFCLFMWKSFGFKEVKAYLSTRPEKAVGHDDKWEHATNSLKKAVADANLECEVDPGGGAFYGPKIDLKIKDAIGREWQTSTIQFDFNLPERFNLHYIGDDGKKHQPYMVHRALLGSLERFFGILIEHYAGAFPTWLAPVQVRILPITDAQHGYANELSDQLQANDIRVECDMRNEGLGAKIRKARNERIPYMLIIGEKEKANNVVSVRKRGVGEVGTINISEFKSQIKKEIEEKE